MSIQLKGANDELWNWVVLSVFACQLPGNIYTIYRSIDQSLSGSKAAVNLMIVLNQVGMIAISLLLLARQSKTIHAANEFMPWLIGSMNNKKSIHLKLKYMELYERLNSDKAIGISIGPFDSITYQMVFEVRGKCEKL